MDSRYGSSTLAEILCARHAILSIVWVFHILSLSVININVQTVMDLW
jgi:hypothetical protein